MAAEIENGDGFNVLSGKSRILLKDGKDVTREFLAGTKESLRIAQLYRTHQVILKDRSPSCGVNYVYNKGRRVRGVGVFAALLIREGFSVISENELTE